MERAEAKFRVGQIIRHELFGYRGVIFDVDMTFQGSEAWYQQMARTKPPKDEPWYHVLVHNAAHTTYVAERNMRPAEEIEPINHPDLELYFSGLDEDGYRPAIRGN